MGEKATFEEGGEMGEGEILSPDRHPALDVRRLTLLGSVRRYRESQHVSLVYASDTKIRCHVKVKADANPFNPADEYFEERRTAMMLDSVSHRQQLVWCLSFCSKWDVVLSATNPFTRETGWHDHQSCIA